MAQGFITGVELCRAWDLEFWGDCCALRLGNTGLGGWRTYRDWAFGSKTELPRHHRACDRWDVRKILEVELMSDESSSTSWVRRTPHPAIVV